MDFSGYLALGGLERIAIIAGAIVIGYWGYRLYAAEKQAGLAFMAIACLVLAGALLTSGSHLRSVSETLQLASVPERPSATPDAAEAEPTGPAPEGAAETPAATPTAAGSAATAPTATSPAATASTGAPAPEAPVAEPAPADAGNPMESNPDLPAAAATVRLATGQELGGRIMSIKGENLSLEWSSAAEPENQ